MFSRILSQSAHTFLSSRGGGGGGGGGEQLDLRPLNFTLTLGVEAYVLHKAYTLSSTFLHSLKNLLWYFNFF